MAQDTLEVARRLRDILNECCIEYVNNAKNSGEFVPAQISALKKHLTSLSQSMFEVFRSRILASDSVNVGQLGADPALDSQLGSLEELFRTRSSELVLLRDCVPEHIAKFYDQEARMVVADDLIEQFNRVEQEVIAAEEEAVAAADALPLNEEQLIEAQQELFERRAEDLTLSSHPLVTAEQVRRLVLTRAEVAAALGELVAALPLHVESTKALVTVLSSSTNSNNMGSNSGNNGSLGSNGGSSTSTQPHRPF